MYITAKKGANMSKLQHVKDFLWPVKRTELWKFMPMMLIVGCSIFNYGLFRSIKDSLVVIEAGPEITPYLKVWAVMPAALIFLIIYTKLSNYFSQKTLFYSVICFFVSFFLIFMILLYPNKDVLHPSGYSKAVIEALPKWSKGFVLMYKFWMFSLFYIMAELWGSVVLSFLFWNFANSLTTVSEAKRFYTHFYLLGNVANIGAGTVIRYFVKNAQHWAPNTEKWQAAMNGLLILSIILCFVMAIAYYYINRTISLDPILMEKMKDIPVKKSKVKLSMLDSFKFLFKSKYLALMAVLVMGYGISINLVEVAWKNQAFIYYGNKSEFSDLIGRISVWTGYATILAILFGGGIIRKFGWKVAALATPIVLGLTSVVFFSCILFPKEFNALAYSFGLDTKVTAVAIAVWVGFAQNVLSKSIKYALFDPTKEMAYIPLDPESRSKGKAAVDVVGARLGKSGGSLIQMGLFSAGCTLSTVGPYSAGISLVVILIWIFAVCELDKCFKQASSKNDQSTD